MAFEPRVEKCYNCEYFIQTDDEDPNGVCARKAPTKLDEVGGDLGTTVYGPLRFFQSLTDAEITFCGEFKYSSNPIPELVVPPT